MQESANGKPQQQRMAAMAPVRRSRSCHYDLRKRVLINNFLKDQHEPRTSTPTAEFKDDAVAESRGGNGLKVLEESFIASDSPTESEPPQTTSAFHRHRVNAPDSPSLSAVRCRRRPGMRQLRQTSLLEANLRSPVTIKRRRSPVSASRRVQNSCSYRSEFGDGYDGQSVHFEYVRTAIRRPVKRLSSAYASKLITYEYPPYKIVIPAVHTDHVVINTAVQRSASSKRGAGKRSSADRSVTSPVSNLRKTSRPVRRRTSIREAFGRLLSQDNRVSKNKRPKKRAKDKLRKSILGSLINWARPAGLSANTKMQETPRDAAATVVRSHSVHVPRRSRADTPRDLRTLRRKSMSSYDYRALRALSSGDNGFD